MPSQVDPNTQTDIYTYYLPLYTFESSYTIELRMQMQALMTSVTMPAKPCVGIAKGLGSSPIPLAVRSSRRAVLRTHAQPEDKQVLGYALYADSTKVYNLRLSWLLR